MLAVLFLSHLLAIMIATEQIHVIFLAFSKNCIPCLRQRSKNHTRPVAHPRIGHVPPPPPPPPWRQIGSLTTVRLTRVTLRPFCLRPPYRITDV